MHGRIYIAVGYHPAALTKTFRHSFHSLAVENCHGNEIRTSDRVTEIFSCALAALVYPASYRAKRPKEAALLQCKLVKTERGRRCGLLGSGVIVC